MGARAVLFFNNNLLLTVVYMATTTSASTLYKSLSLSNSSCCLPNRINRVVIETNEDY